MFGPFHPFWIRKPVPVIPPSMFPPSMHHPSASSHAPMAHHQNSFNSNCVPFSFINFRGSNHSVANQHENPSVESKVNQKREFFDSATLQSIKNEFFSSSNNDVSSVSVKLNIPPQNNNNNNNNSFNTVNSSSAAIANSYEDEDFNNDNIDVETDSDNDQHLCELKQLNYHNLSDATAIKSEEWSKIIKNTVMLKSNHIEQLIASTNDSSSLSPFSQNDSTQNISNNNNNHPHPIISEIKIDAEHVKEMRLNVKRVFATDDDDSEYFNEPFTDHNLLNLSDKKKRKFGNTKGFSIESLIGRIVEDR